MVMKLSKTFSELKAAVLEHGSFVPVTEDLYYEALGAVPPIFLTESLFQVGEEFSNGLFYTFGVKDGIYYGCLCNSNYAINNF